MKILFIIFLLLVKADQTPEEVAPPLYSEKGKKRFAEHIKILDENIRVLLRNVGTSNKNLKTLQQELDELTQLEKEHVELKKRFEDYLKEGESKAVSQEKSQKKVTEEVAKIKKKHRTLEEEVADGSRGRLVTLLKEKEELDRWDIDAKEKMKKVHELLATLEESKEQVKGKKESVRKQMTNWVESQKQFQKGLEEMQQKRANFEKAIQREKLTQTKKSG